VLEAALRATGRRVDSEPGLAVSARKGKVSALLYPEPQHEVVIVELVRSRPGPIRPLELAGWVAGLLLGWPAALRLSSARRPARALGLDGAARAALAPECEPRLGPLAIQRFFSAFSGDADRFRAYSDGRPRRSAAGR
jgi:hypothetical protein